MGNIKCYFIILFFCHYVALGQINQIDNNRPSNQIIYSFLTNDLNRKISLSEIFTEQPVYLFSDSSKFWGDTTKNSPNGYGLKSKLQKSIYIGKFKDGKRDGFGIQLTEDKFYIGSFQDDEISGKGDLYIFKDSTQFLANEKLLINSRLNELVDTAKLLKQFVGVFSEMGKGKENILVGKEIRFGRVVNSTITIKMSVFSGKFIGGKLTEPGTLELVTTVPNGSLLFLGSIAAGKNGNSQLYSINRSSNQSTLYEGDFTSLFNFTGKMTSYDGTTTEGVFTDLEVNGVGKRYNENYYYEGNFIKNQINGRGKVTYKATSNFAEGSYFDGNWVDGKADYGETYLAATDEYIKGKYVNGSLDGKVTITKNGKTTTGTYSSGTRQ